MAESVRIDRWLWAARFFKTRALAKKAVDGGKVDINGLRAKPAKPIKIGDEVAVSREDFQLVMLVEGLSERRLGAALAAELYSETRASVEAREQVMEQRRLRRDDLSRPLRRPDKRSRRRLLDLKGR